MNILVLSGGYSPERDVSLTSGSLIANALRREGERVCLADVYLGIDESRLDDPELFVIADLNHDGEINAKDSNILKRYLSGEISGL